MTKGRRGFTLIELQVVMIIIGILAAIAIPQFEKYIQRSRDTAIKLLLLEIGSKQREYKLSKGTFLACDINPFRPTDAWNEQDAWKKLKFVPGHSLYGYQFEVKASKSSFTAMAIRDGQPLYTVDHLSYEITDMDSNKMSEE